MEEMVENAFDADFLNRAEEVVTAATGGEQLHQPVPADVLARTVALCSVGTVLSGLLNQAPAGAGSRPWSDGSVFALLKQLSLDNDIVIELAHLQFE